MKYFVKLSVTIEAGAEIESRPGGPGPGGGSGAFDNIVAWQRRTWAVPSTETAST